MTEQDLDKILQQYLKEVHSCIPEKCFDGYGYSGIEFHASLSDDNINFKDTQYFYPNEKKFVHWTTTERLMSIINNREIRFYNLHNSSDVDEFVFAASHLPIDDIKINHLKKYLYTFSFCEAIEINNPDLWSSYGKGYSGVALEFEIINNADTWKRFMLSSVYYELPKPLIDLRDKLDVLKSEYPSMRTDFDFGRLIGFHKRPDFSIEKEIRLSTLYPFGDNYEAYLKYCKPDFRFDVGRHRMTSYFGLQLWVNNEDPFLRTVNPIFDRKLVVEDDYFITKPQIKLKKITFGKNCGVSNREFSSYNAELKAIFLNQFGYDVELPINLFG